MQKQLNTIVKGAGVVLLGMFLSKIFSYVWRLIIARTGVESYGIFILGMVVIEVGIMLSFLGPPQSIERFASYYFAKGDKNKTLGVIKGTTILAMTAASVMALLIFIYADFISQTFFHTPQLVPVLKIMTVALPFLIGSRLLFASMKALQNIVYAVISRDIIDGLLKIILIGSAFYFGYGLMGITIGFTLATVSVFFIMGYFLRNLIKSKIGTGISTEYNYKELLIFSLPLLLNEISWATIKWTDSLFLGYFKTASEVGIYNAAVPTASLIMNIPLAMLTLFLAIISAEYARNNMTGIKDIYTTVSKWIVVLSIPITATMILFSKPLLSILFGAEYAVGWLALIILVVRYFIAGVTLINSHISTMLKKTTFILKTTLAGAIIGVALNIILIPRLGFVGAALSSAISMAIMSATYVIFVYRNIGVLPFNKKTFSLTTIFLAITAMLTYLLNTSKLTLLFTTLLFIVLIIFYSIVIFKWKLIGTEE